MTLPAHNPSAGASRPLAGRKGWIITDGKAGMDVQALGVAAALGLDVVMKTVAPRGLWRALSPFGPVNPSERFGGPGTPFAPPWPDIAIATGRLSIPYARALKRAAGPATFLVILQDPRVSRAVADLVWVPAHDRLRGPDVITTLTAPHAFTAARLAQLRAQIQAEIAALPAPRVTVILGGNNKVYTFTPGDHERLAAALASLGKLGASFLITPSRRTPAGLIAKIEQATAGRPRVLWDGSGDNPYPAFLAHADILVVTADSVNMTGEACATGRPVLVFHPTGGSSKFARFHAGLEAAGATRELAPHLDAVPGWRYTPLSSADRIAADIERRMATRGNPAGAAWLREDL